MFLTKTHKEKLKEFRVNVSLQWFALASWFGTTRCPSCGEKYDSLKDERDWGIMVPVEGADAEEGIEICSECLTHPERIDLNLYSRRLEKLGTPHETIQTALRHIQLVKLRILKPYDQPLG
jgi:hypothetical protein